jgi:hypothetical protein
MAPQKIKDKLDKLYDDKKARSFFNHLIRAYFPVDKVEIVKNRPNGNFNCVLSNLPLISHNEILIGIHSKDIDRELLEQLKTMFSATTNSQHPTTKAIIGGKFIGVTTKETTTDMAFNVFQIFYDWVVSRMLLGDKHINWLLKDIDRSEFMDRAETVNNPELKERITKTKLTNPSQATFTLGDLDALKELKNRMENK